MIGQNSANRGRASVRADRTLVRRAEPGAVVRLLRPRQWLKNGVVGAALVFAGRLTNGADVRSTALAVVLFCAVSSAGYLVNDVTDVASDRRHPVKRFRPVASQEVSPQFALSLAAGLLI